MVCHVFHRIEFPPKSVVKPIAFAVWVLFAGFPVLFDELVSTTCLKATCIPHDIAP